MAYNTILVHCDAGKALPHRLDVAVDLAERFGSHLVGFHARPPFEMPGFTDGSFPTTGLLEAWEADKVADEATAKEAFFKATKGRNAKCEWRVSDGYSDRELATGARYADLVVVGQNDREQADAKTPSDLPEVTALAAGRPILVVPHVGAARRPGNVVLLCWNASREAARAATEALPILKGANQVVVLVIDAKESASGHGAEPGADVATWLSRHGVKVTVQRDVAPDSDVGSLILSRAADHDADLIVMGVYGHSRLREMVMGGASRTLLGSMTVPVLMAH
jgi:nucleotide-binding universal stress UspA family protein